MKDIKFGTGGFRGVIGDTFTKENITLIAQALANLVKEDHLTKPLVIGYDYRFLSKEAALWMSEVFSFHHIHVMLSSEEVPTPSVMYMVKKHDLDYGIMITASHNPYIFNGIKVFQKEGMDGDVALTSRIEKEFHKITSIESKPFEVAINDHDIEMVSFLNDYVLNIENFISPLVRGSNLHILFDSLHGVGEKSLMKIASDFKLNNFHALHVGQDAYFNFKNPNPTRENMEEDKEILLKNHYDLALGLDSDGDRLGILDENGNYVDSNEILASLYYYLVKYRGMKGDIVKNLATSNLVDKVAEKLGFKCHEVDVGFKNISSMMKKCDALIGGESSGGLTIRNYLYGKDSTFSSSLFLEMMIIMKKNISSIVKEVRDFACFHHTIIEDHIAYHHEDIILNYLKNHTFVFPDEIVSKEIIANNVKYRFKNDCWLLLRGSGTEPMLRIFIEMETKEKANEYLKILKQSINEVDHY